MKAHKLTLAYWLMLAQMLGNKKVIQDSKMFLLLTKSTECKHESYHPGVFHFELLLERRCIFSS